MKLVSGNRHTTYLFLPLLRSSAAHASVANNHIIARGATKPSLISPSDTAQAFCSVKASDLGRRDIAIAVEAKGGKT